MPVPARGVEQRSVGDAPRSGSAGRLLAIWMAGLLVLEAMSWGLGLHSTRLAIAVDAGTAVAERAGMGEESPDAVRKAIQLQRDTTGFWSVLGMVGDLLVEPTWLAARAFGVATAFAGLALLGGRPSRFAESLWSTTRAQGFWVLGAAVRLVLGLLLRRPGIETSATLLLGDGGHPALLWVGLQQLDVFAALGWLTMAWDGWRSRRVGLVGAVLVCGGLWAIESVLRAGWSLLVEGSIRLTLMPG